VKIEGLELRWASLPLVGAFRTSFGSEDRRDLLLLRLVTDQAEGWSECVAMAAPVYSPEYVDAAAHVIEHVLFPEVTALSDPDVHAVSRAMQRFHGHQMAKAALETSFLDAELRSLDLSLARYLGGAVDRVASGVSVGIMDSIPQLLDAVGGYLDQGYVRIKLKIEPGWDVEPVRAVRERFGDEVPLQVDANTAYTVGDARQLAKLDPFDLLLIEQPLPEDDLLGHAQLAKLVRTPICLDESITSAKVAADAITLGACSIVNIKPGRVGGYLESRRVHDVCQAHGVPVWCGGMLETGVGRAANLALASLPGFTLPGDTSASDRYYHRDLTEPFTLENGHVRVPTGPGIGVTPVPEILRELTTEIRWLPANG